MTRHPGHETSCSGKAESFATDPPLISVVLATYNRVNTLPVAIQSVLNQTYENFELVLVDDASTDGTRSLLMQFSDSRIRYICHDERRGAPSAWNTGIKQSQGDFIAFQDSDDEWFCTKLAKQIEIFHARQDIDIVYSSYVRVSPDSQDLVPPEFTLEMRGDIFERVLSAWWIGSPTMLIRKEAFDKAGLFNESLEAMQDWELIIRLARHYSFEFVPEPLMKAYISRDSISASENKKTDSIEKILTLHKGLYDEHPRAKAFLLTFIANRRAVKGQMNQARNYFRKALHVCPSFMQAWLGYLLSFWGHTLYINVLKIKRGR